MTMKNNLTNSDLIKASHLRYINLSHRRDRKVKMEYELRRIGLPAMRFEALRPNQYQGDPERVAVMRNRTPGAIGCHLSQVEVMKQALSLGKHAFVMEDDLVFCSDFVLRIFYLENWIAQGNNDWDIIWLGGTFHVNPPYWHTGKNPDLPLSKIGRDAETTFDPRIMRTYGAFSTYAYIVNINSIPRVLHLLDENLHLSMGIDWIMIKIQPQLKTFAFVPGCVKQYDNMSDIGKGVTRFSGFAKLGPYWWQDLMVQFDPVAFDWKEAKIKNYGTY